MARFYRGEVLVELDAAAARLGLCTPACALTTLSDASDAWGDRTVRVRCATHGEKAVTLRRASTAPARGGLHSQGSQGSR